MVVRFSIDLRKLIQAFLSFSLKAKMYDQNLRVVVESGYVIALDAIKFQRILEGLEKLDEAALSGMAALAQITEGVLGEEDSEQVFTQVNEAIATIKEITKTEEGLGKYIEQLGKQTAQNLRNVDTALAALATEDERVAHSLNDTLAAINMLQEAASSKRIDSYKKLGGAAEKMRAKMNAERKQVKDYQNIPGNVAGLKAMPKPRKKGGKVVSIEDAKKAQEAEEEAESLQEQA